MFSKESWALGKPAHIRAGAHNSSVGERTKFFCAVLTFRVTCEKRRERGGGGGTRRKNRSCWNALACSTRLQRKMERKETKKRGGNGRKLALPVGRSVGRPLSLSLPSSPLLPSLYPGYANCFPPPPRSDLELLCNILIREKQKNLIGEKLYQRRK